MGQLIAALVGAAVVAAAYRSRCALGWHPPGRRMLSGRRVRGESVAAWECLRCGRVVATTAVRVDPRLLRSLRMQMKAARQRCRLAIVDKKSA